MYKDILWIDDVDNSDSLPAADDLEAESEADSLPDCKDIEYIKNHFGESTAAYIQLEKSFYKACEIIEKESDRFNFVIFDLDMNKGMSEPIERINKKFFSRYNIDCDPDTPDTKARTIIGIKLYMLLLAKGYPIDRMMIYTGNGKFKNEDKGILPFNLNNIVKVKPDSDEEHIDIDNDYFGGEDNSYYRVRRLVYQACDHWKNHLNRIQTEDIEFNKVYFKDQEPIDKNTFEDMLECVKRMFPVVRPDDPNELYYLAMREASQFHEERADIKKAKKTLADRFPYHSMIRYFRNWSAHNKVSTHNLTPQQFALLFCITLKTYFCDVNSDVNSFNKPLDYEGLWGFQITESEDDFQNEIHSMEFNRPSEDDFQSKIHSMWKRLQDECIQLVPNSADDDLIKFINEHKNVFEGLYAKDMNTKILKCGIVCTKMDIEYIFILPWCDKISNYSITNNGSSPDILEFKICSGSNPIILIDRDYFIQYGKNSDGTNRSYSDLCDQADKSLYMKYCYDLLN